MARTTLPNDALEPFRRRKHELSMLDGCVLWGNRVIEPLAGRKEVLSLLHEGHPGIIQNEVYRKASCLVAWNRQGNCTQG